MKDVCRFTFDDAVSREAIEGQLSLAVLVAECVFGQARVRLNVSYLTSDDSRCLAVDVSHEVGAYIAQVFTGLLIRYVGEERFGVERVEK